MSLNHTRAEVTRAESDIADLGKKLSAETAKEADLIRKQADINSGVVQIRVTPKTRNPFTIKALSISGVTWKWHFLNHASHDVLALAGPGLATRRELFDFIVSELGAREPEDARRIRPVRVALQNQRDDLLAWFKSG